MLERARARYFIILCVLYVLCCGGVMVMMWCPQHRNTHARTAKNAEHFQCVFGPAAGNESVRAQERTRARPKIVQCVRHCPAASRTDENGF